jgi:hypothetical protein
MISMATSNPNGYTITNLGYGTIVFNMYGTEYINGYSSFSIQYHNTSINIIPFTGNGWVIR